MEINIDKLKISDNNVRKNIRNETLEELIENIRNNGLLSPLIVNEYEKDKYEIIAGQRRFEALKKLNYNNIPCKIYKNLSKNEKLSYSLAENIQRDKMKLSELVKGIIDLYNISDKNIDTVCKYINKPKKIVDKYLKICELNDDILDKLDGNYKDKLTLEFCCDLVNLKKEKDFTDDDINELVQYALQLPNKIRSDIFTKVRINCKSSNYEGAKDLIDELKNDVEIINKLKEFEEEQKHKKRCQNMDKLKNLKIDYVQQEIDYQTQQMRKYSDEIEKLTKIKQKLEKKESENKVNHKTKLNNKNDIDNINDKSNTDDIINYEQIFKENNNLEYEKYSNLKDSIYIISRQRNPILQSKFRDKVINRFNKCIISDFHSDLCEASHIIPLSECENFDIDNGLLLNCCLHKLFDNFHFSINPNTLMIEIYPKSKHIEYLEQYKNKKINIDSYQNTIQNIILHYNKFCNFFNK